MNEYSIILIWVIIGRHIASWTHIISIMRRYFPQATAFYAPLVYKKIWFELAAIQLKQQAHASFPVFCKIDNWPEINCFVLSTLIFHRVFAKFASKY